MLKRVRLQKFIADCGIMSRRKAENFILESRVQVNGKIVDILGTKIDVDQDVVEVDGKIADLSLIQPIYLVMNKPRGYLSTLDDPQGRRTIMDLCMEISERIYPIGRLDYLSEGLLLLTNDGELSHHIMHPKFNIIKVYEVKVFGMISPPLLRSLQEGVELSTGHAKPISVRIIKQLYTKTWLEFRLSEGRNREIRKICESCKIVIDKLRRVAIGNLSIEGIGLGKYRILTKKKLLSRIGSFSDHKKPSFNSSKRTIFLKNKQNKFNGTLANDDRFQKFKKETYFDSLKLIEISKQMTLKKQREEAFTIKEEALNKRKQRKIKKFKRKEEKELYAPHAIILKN